MKREGVLDTNVVEVEVGVVDESEGEGLAATERLLVEDEQHERKKGEKY